jgi:hypothetical protein
MSSESNTVVAPVVDVVVVTEKKVKAPTLGAKYSRFMAFGHWFVSQQSTELVSEEVREELYRKLMVFASLEEQTAFYEGFLSQVTATNKTIRKMVAASKKPVKAPKAPRAKKTKAALPQDGLVAQLIADANSSDVEQVASEVVVAAAAEKKPKAPRAKKVKAAAEPPTNEAGEPVVVAEKKPKAPRAKKVKAVAAEPVANSEPSPELVAETVVENVVETVVENVVEPVAAAAPTEVKKTKKSEKAEKPKKSDSEKPKKTKKTKAAVEPVADESVEDDIDTRMVTIADKEYLIDGDNNLYGVEPPHAQVGTFNPESGEATLN